MSAFDFFLLALVLDALLVLEDVLSKDILEVEFLEEDLEGAKDDILDGDLEAFNEDIMNSGFISLSAVKTSELLMES